MDAVRVHARQSHVRHAHVRQDHVRRVHARQDRAVPVAICVRSHTMIV